MKQQILSFFMVFRPTSVAAIPHLLHQISPQISFYLPRIILVGNSMEGASRHMPSDTVRNFAMVADSGSKEPVSLSDSSYDEEFLVLSPNAISPCKNRKSNKIRTRVDLSTEGVMRENNPLHHESPPMSNSTSGHFRHITAKVGAVVLRVAIAEELAEGHGDVGPRELEHMSKEETVEYITCNMRFPVYSLLVHEK